MASGEHTVKVLVKPRFDAVVTRPGDTLIVRLDGDLPQARLNEIVDGLTAQLPGVKVLVMNAAQFLVYRPDEAAGD